MTRIFFFFWGNFFFTLQYIQKQVSVLEEGIRKSWALVGPAVDQASGKTL